MPELEDRWAVIVAWPHGDMITFWPNEEAAKDTAAGLCTYSESPYYVAEIKHKVHKPPDVPRPVEWESLDGPRD